VLGGFRGSFDLSLDAQGRIVLPVPFRKVAGESFMLMYGSDGGLFGFDVDQWGQIMERAAETEAEWTPDFRRYVATATIVNKETASHRITIPEHMQEFADVKCPCKAVVLGAGVRFEVWNPTRHRSLSIGRFVPGLITEAAKAARAPELA
jgi:DNA-binding transcriptional regulator/RsmH inhibitor MraZ